MHYRHILEFENSAELSAIHISDGKIVLRVRSLSEEKPPVDVSKNYLYPLFCSRQDETWQISAGGLVKSVNKKIWEIIDQINRSGEYALREYSDDAIRQASRRVNAALKSVGLKYRIIHDGPALKPEFLDLQSGI